MLMIFKLRILPVVLCIFLAGVPFCISSNSSRCLEEDPETLDSSFDISPHLGHVSRFSVDLFREITSIKKEGNLFMSPYSIWNALALAYLGSDGGTEKQLQHVLGLESKIDTLKQWRAVNYVYQVRQLYSKGFSFGLVNKAYFHKDFPLRKCIHDVLIMDVELVDFSKAEEAALTINEYVNEMTEGNIGSVVSPSDIEDARMALVNVAFFKDLWKTPFKKNKSKKERFYPFSGEEQYVDMMKRKGQFKHGVSERLRAHVLELPYTLKDVSMFILLPASVEREKGLNYLIQNLTAKALQEITEEVWYDNIEVAIPRLSLASSMDSELKESLQHLGVTDLFDPQKANLTTFVPEGGLSVSKTLHQTYLKVSEEGTEAGATTAVIGTGRSARPSFLRSFICDHPFVFTIYDKFTKNILFIGVVRDAP